MKYLGLGLVLVFLALGTPVQGSDVGRPTEASNLASESWGRSYFPNVPLTTQDGQRVGFFALIQGRVVVINFIYTSCPDVCPLETARLAEVAAILGDRVGQDIFFFSITIDPEVDTPEVLKAYSERYGAGAGWTFLTGRESDITILRKKLGLYIADIQGEDSNDHNINLVIGNQSTGRWMKRSPYENPRVLADHVGSWLHNWKNKPTGKKDFENAPALRPLATGEGLFRTRCAVCHTIGGGDKLEIGSNNIGPDLFGVSDRRDHSWLSRWIAEPDVMLAEKDPTAMTLFESFNQVPMPNLSLSPGDVGALIEYMNSETRRVASIRKTQPELARARAEAEAKGVSCCEKGEGPTIARAPQGKRQRGSSPSRAVAFAVFLGGLTSAMGASLSLLQKRSG